MIWRLARAAAVLTILATGAVFGLNWWVDSSDAPAKSDMIVALAGGFARPFYAADLYREGYAPEVWISRPAGDPSEALLATVGIKRRTEWEIDREILLRRGVPAARIHLYGDGVLSTANEALALKAAVDTRDKRVLVVTSRFHARRARIIFRRLLPGATVRVVATTYEPPLRRWWRDRFLAEYVMIEPVKMVFYWLGGMYVAGRRGP